MNAQRDEEGLISDELFIALTRPATIMGAPYIAVVFEVVIVAILFIGSGMLRFWLLLPLIHGVLYAITATDHGKLESLFLGARTLLSTPNRPFWKAASFSPARVRNPRGDDGYLGI